MQDFYATMYPANLSAFIAGAANEQIKAKDAGKKLKYQCRFNYNRTNYKLRHHFLRLIMESDPDIRNLILSHIMDSIADKPVPIAPNRSPDRKTPRKKRFHIAKKPVV